MELYNLIEGIGWSWYVETRPRNNDARVKMLCMWLKNPVFYTQLQDNADKALVHGLVFLHYALHKNDL